MKKILTAALLTVLMVTVVFAQKATSPYKTVGAALPPLRIIDRQMKAHTEDDIRKKNHFFLVMFNPTCSHCMDMAKLFGTHEKEFKKNTVIFVSASDMMPYLDHFYKETGADDFKNLTIGIDSSNIINNLYKYGSLPQINIYDKDQKLVKVFSGETPLDSLMNYVD